MSSFQKLTKHPKDGHWETAWWLDDYFGHHRYGVQFASTGQTFPADDYQWETKEPIVEDVPEQAPPTEVSEPTPREELTTEQKVRFQILIDYHLAMESKRQADEGTNQISDGSQISKRAWKRIEQLIHAEVLAVLDRLEKWVAGNKHDMGELGEFIRTQYVYNHINEEKQRYGGKEQK